MMCSRAKYEKRSLGMERHWRGASHINVAWKPARPWTSECNMHFATFTALQGSLGRCSAEVTAAMADAAQLMPAIDKISDTAFRVSDRLNAGTVHTLPGTEQEWDSSINVRMDYMSVRRKLYIGKAHPAVERNTLSYGLSILRPMQSR